MAISGAIANARATEKDGERKQETKESERKKTKLQRRRKKNGNVTIEAIDFKALNAM